MNDAYYSDRASRFKVVLLVAGLALVLLGLASTAAVVRVAMTDSLQAIAEDMGLSPLTVASVAGSLVLLVLLSGFVSLLRLRWGWVVTMTTGPLLILMALLAEPRTQPISRMSFYVMSLLFVLCCFTAVIHYFHDLYT